VAVLRWLAGDAETRRVVDAWLSGRRGSEEIASGARRRLDRIESDAGPGLLVKRFTRARGAAAARAGLVRSIGRDACSREWRALCALRAAGVSVPTPRGRARAAGGDALLIADFVPGPSLWHWLEAPVDAAERGAWLRRVAEAVGRLHGAGFAHGDLHPGNVVLGPDGPVLLDFQRSRSARPGGRAQIADLGLLDYGLSQRGIPRADRVRVRRIALEASGAAATQARLGAVGAAARRIATRHASRRMRQATRTGGRFERCTIDGRPALLAPGQDPAELARILVHHAAAVEAADALPEARVSRLDTPTHAYRCESTPLGLAPARVAGFRAARAGVRAWRAAEGRRVRRIEGPDAVALLGPAPDASARESTLILAGRVEDARSADAHRRPPAPSDHSLSENARQAPPSTSA
jgi:tRNA A-37 threonylcarbamoyl transferase component Bud32